MIETKKTICPLDCPDSCALIVTIDNGRVVKMEGDPDHEITKGFICRKMRTYPERVESDERILHPMRRIGVKGSGEFKQISWNEAWQILVDKLTELKSLHGAEALLPYSYAGNMGHISQNAGESFFHRFGTSLLGDTICSATARAGWKAHLGKRPGTDPLVATDSKLIVAWGINIKTTNIHFWPLVQQCRRKGGKLVVIDPYRNITAKAADYHFQVKPGGDSALALGVIKSITKDSNENKEFIKNKTTGFEDLKQYVSRISWQAIEKDSGIEKRDIETLTQLLLDNPQTFIRIGVGLSRNSRGAMSVRSIVCLALALGLLDDGSGKGILLTSGSFYTDEDKLTYPSLRKKPARVINMVQLGNALTECNPKIHGLFIYNSNPLSVAPETSLVRKGLERDDLFTAVHEQMLTPTARYADLILPATTVLEHRDLYFGYGHFYMGITEAAIQPRGEAVDNFTLFQTLAEKMGYTEPPFKQSLEDRIQDYLSDIKGLPPSVSIDAIKPGHPVKSIFNNREIYEQQFLPYKFASESLESSQSPIPCLGTLAEFDDM